MKMINFNINITKAKENQYLQPIRKHKSYDNIIEIYQRYSDLIIDHISKTKASLNLLDDAILKEIYEQEAAVCPTEMTAAEALAADGVENE